MLGLVIISVFQIIYGAELPLFSSVLVTLCILFSAYHEHLAFMRWYNGSNVTITEHTPDVEEYEPEPEELTGEKLAEDTRREIEEGTFVQSYVDSLPREDLSNEVFTLISGNISGFYQHLKREGKLKE